MKKRVFIIHGWGGHPEQGWLPWLKKELENGDFEVAVPAMPNTENPEIGKWVSKLAQAVGIPDKNTYFVGHSIGCQTILRYLEIIDTKVGGAIFVAGWFNLENLEDEKSKEIAEPWLNTTIDIDKVKRALPKSTLVISDSDPYGAFEENNKKFKELGSKIVVMKSAGHIASEDGYAELPEALFELKNLAR